MLAAVEQWSACDSMSASGAFVRLAVRYIIADKKQAFVSMIGIIIGIGLVSGAFIGVDSAQKSIIRNELGRLPVDFNAYGGLGDYNYTLEAITSVSGVTDAEVLASTVPVLFAKWTPDLATTYVHEGFGNERRNTLNTTPIKTGYGDIYGVRPRITDYLDKFTITLDKDSAINTTHVLISQTLAKEFNITRGEKISFIQPYIFYDSDDANPSSDDLNFSVRFYNLTVTGFFLKNSNDARPRGDARDREVERLSYITDTTVIVHIDTLPKIVDALNEKPTKGLTRASSVNGAVETGSIPYYGYDNVLYITYQFLIWIDKDKCIDLNNIDATLRNLDSIHIKLSHALIGSNVWVEESTLKGTIESIQSTMGYVKGLLFVVALPAVFLGMYLGIIGIDISMDKRRREIGILKSRGASNGMIFALILFESVVLGAIAGILGFLLGIVTYSLTFPLIFSTSRMFGMEFSTADLMISVETIVLLLAVSIGLMILASIRPGRAYAKLPTVECISHYCETAAQKKYKMTVDIVFIILATVTYANMLLFSRTGGPTGSDGGVILFFAILFTILVPLIPVAPFFMIFGITRLVTRKSPKVYGVLSKLTKPLAKDLYPVVHKNLLRNPKRTSRVALIISLAVTFGLFVSIMSDSETAYNERLILARVGADIKVDYNTDITLMRDLSSLPDVEHITEAAFGFALITGAGQVPVIQFNASAYLHTVDPRVFNGPYSKSPSLKQAIHAVTENNTCLVTERLANQFKVDIGDSLIISDVSFNYEPSRSYVEGPIVELDGEGTNLYQNKQYILRVVGIIRLLPGLEQEYGITEQVCQIYIDTDTLGEGRETINYWRYLIDVRSGADPSTVADEIDAAFGGYSSLQVLKEEFADTDPIMDATLGFFKIEYTFIILIITVGLGLIIYISSLERENETAAMIARGASRKHIVRMYMSEGVTIIILSLILGILTALLTSFVFIDLQNMNSLYTGPALIREVTLLAPTWILLIITVVSLLLITLLTSFLASRVKVHSALRIRGG